MSDPNLTRVIEFKPRARGLFEEVADALGIGAVERFWNRECGAEVIPMDQGDVRYVNSDQVSKEIKLS